MFYFTGLQEPQYSDSNQHENPGHIIQYEEATCSENIVSTETISEKLTDHQERLITVAECGITKKPSKDEMQSINPGSHNEISQENEILFVNNGNDDNLLEHVGDISKTIHEGHNENLLNLNEIEEQNNFGKMKKKFSQGQG